MARGKRRAQHLLFTRSRARLCPRRSEISLKIPAPPRPSPSPGARGAPEPPRRPRNFRALPPTPTRWMWECWVGRGKVCGKRGEVRSGAEPARGGSGRAGRQPGAPTRLSLQCKLQRDKLLINSLEEKALSFFLLFFICFYFCMAPSYALGSLTAQRFSLHFNILKKMQITTLWPF